MGWIKKGGDKQRIDALKIGEVGKHQLARQTENQGGLAWRFPTKGRPACCHQTLFGGAGPSVLGVGRRFSDDRVAQRGINCNTQVRKKTFPTPTKPASDQGAPEMASKNNLDLEGGAASISQDKAKHRMGVSAGAETNTGNGHVRRKLKKAGGRAGGERPGPR